MNPESGVDVEGAESERQICCTMASVLMRLTQELAGRDAVAELLRVSGTKHDEAFLDNPDHWISVQEAVALLEAGQEITGDPQLARKVGEQTVRQHAGSQVATLLRSLGSPEAILSNMALAAGRFSTVTEMAALECEPGRAVITSRPRTGITRHKLHCDWTAGLLSQPTVLFGLPPAHVEETECNAEGAPQCSYVITWDAAKAAEAADPANQVTALEAQLTAMAKHLRSVYETAGDLLSPDELDLVLARIVERAAGTVRAPAYVLAVRTAPEAELSIYCDGVDRRQALEIGEAASSGNLPHARGVGADVASGRRSYGHLIALCEKGMEFFPQEKELLELYAKHAAAVLDMAMALEESARRHRDVGALLSLTEALAQTATSQEVAARTRELLPEVIDCDHVAVYGWDEGPQALEALDAREAHGERPPTILTDTPLLDILRAEGRPRFFTADNPDEAIAGFMADHELEAMAVVPISTHDSFLGALVTGVHDRPERLAPSMELIERLTGIAALAAPPLQTARLIRELRHQAEHDPLTGLPNRAAFTERMDRSIDAGEGAETKVSLLFIDLDEFKQVNDTYGHSVGDELLCQVAKRLESLLRSNDSVARLGGDEFAVVLEGIDSADALEAAAARVRDVFVEPFVVENKTLEVSASVGCSSFPDEAGEVRDLLLQADADMYREKAQSRVRASAGASLG
jgi:diguanylate cyclase (GGDEF)-like protein